MGLAARRAAFMEFLLNSGYTDVTQYLRQTSALTITRGKGSEQGKVAPATLAALMDTTDGVMNPLNPSGTYYTSLRNKNLPGRFGMELARDFCTRTVANGWGTTDVAPVAGKAAPTAEVWTIGPTVADYAVNGGVAKHTMPVAGDTRYSYMNGLAGVGNCEFRADIHIPAPTAGASFNRAGFLLRGETPATDALWVHFSLDRFGNARIKAVELAGGTLFDTPIVLASTDITLVVAIEGRMIFAKAYATSAGAEPFDWPIFGNMTSTSSDFGWVGCQSQSNTTDANVTITYDNIKVRSYRFAGEIVSLEPNSNLAHTDKNAQLNMSTTIRRLAKPQAPLSSTMRRGVIRATIQPVAYWPMEEGKTATQFAPLVGTQPMVRDPARPTVNVAAVKPGVNTEFNCSDALPTLNGVEFAGKIDSYSNPFQQLETRLLFGVPDQFDPADSAATIMTIFTTVTGTNYTTQWSISWTPPSSPTEGYGWLYIFATDSVGNTLVNNGPFLLNIYERLNRIQFQLKQNGANVDWVLNVALGANLSQFDGSLGITTVSGTSAVAATLGIGKQLDIGLAPFFKNWIVGHAAVYNQWLDIFNAAKELTAWSGEASLDRFIRLCTEEGEPDCYQGATGWGNTQSMGPQKLKTLLNHLQDCADTDQGEFLESVTTGFLMLRTGNDLKNQGPKVTIDYSNGQVGPGFVPKPDDKPTINDVTLKRDGGGSFQVEKATGVMNTQRPGKDPDAAGRNPTSPTFSALNDAQLPQIANFILLRGTNPETRWPKVPILFQAASISTTNTELGVLSTNIDDYFKIANLNAAWGVPDALQLMAIGYTETWINEFIQGINFNSAPYSPYFVFFLDSTRLDTDTSKLTADITNSQTSFQVTDTSGGRWVTTASEPAEFPFTIIIDGERMNVTGIVGAASPQTFTVIRSINGVINIHRANARVTLADPVYLS